jgi:hypothetical protein
MRWWCVVLLAGCKGFFNPMPPDGHGADGSPGAPLQYVQSGLGKNQASQVTAPLPVAETAGNTVVVALSWGSGSLLGLSDTRGNTYVSAIGPVSGPGAIYASVFVATNVAGGTNQVTASFDTGPIAIAAILEYSGVATPAVDAAASGLGGSAMPPTSAPVTTTAAQDLLIAVAASDTDVGGTTVPTYTTHVVDQLMVVADRVVPPGEYSAAVSATNNTSWVMALVALRGN